MLPKALEKKGKKFKNKTSQNHAVPPILLFTGFISPFPDSI